MNGCRMHGQVARPTSCRRMPMMMGEMRLPSCVRRVQSHLKTNRYTQYFQVSSVQGSDAPRMSFCMYASPTLVDDLVEAAYLPHA